MPDPHLCFHGTLTLPDGHRLAESFCGSRENAFREMVETAAADTGCDADLIDHDDEDGALRFGGVVLGTVAVALVAVR